MVVHMAGWYPTRRKTATRAQLRAWREFESNAAIARKYYENKRRAASRALFFIGRAIIPVHAALARNGRGEFRDWLLLRTDIHFKYAERARYVFLEFEDYEDGSGELVAQFNAKALIFLACSNFELDPPDAILRLFEKAIERAGRGHVITFKFVEDTYYRLLGRMWPSEGDTNDGPGEVAGQPLPKCAYIPRRPEQWSPIEQLKRAWEIASMVERRKFMRWVQNTPTAEMRYSGQKPLTTQQWMSPLAEWNRIVDNLRMKSNSGVDSVASQ